MSTALTASVWGQGRAAVALSAQVVAQQGLKDGDEECHICRDDIPATIAFVPCKHKVCFGCVENMRAKNIFKSDKGIKCPFCRQYVDGYRSILAPNELVQKFLQEANKAANIAAQARAAVDRKAMGLAPAPAAAAAGPSSSAPAGSRPVFAGSSAAASAASSEDQQWNCGSCGTANFMWREFCGNCKRPCPNPYGSDKLSQTRKDLAAVSCDELVSYIRDQGAFALRKGLRDMGVTLDSWRSYGGVQCIREATAMFGLKRRVLRMAELLSDPDALRNASLSPLGNLGVQRIFEAMAKLRLAFPPERPNKDLQEFKVAHGGKDPFAVLLEAMMARMLEYCLHEKGVYVAQCAANLANNTELVALARVVFPLGLPVSRDPRGVFVLLSLLDLFSQRIWDDPVNCPLALQAVDLLCNQFSASDKQVLHTAHHALSGKVLIRAIAVSMPRQPALRLAVKIASMAATLAGSSGGLATLTELLQLYGHNQQAAEGLRDVATTMCYSMQGQLNRYAVAGDEVAQDMLLCLVERLGHEQEQGWLDSIAQELVGACDALVENPNGLEILKFTLSQPCMDLDGVSTHIADMKSVLGKKALLPIVGDIMERVASNPPAAPPKYPAASVIQPELRYYLQQSWPIPLPPPPPPRPGEPGYEEYAQQAAARAEAQAKAAAAARAEKEAAAQARRDAAVAAAAEKAAAANGSSSNSNVEPAVLDAWGSARAGGIAAANAWGGVDSNGNGNNAVCAGSGSASSSSAATSAGTLEPPASNPWGAVMQSPQDSRGNSSPWGDGWAGTTDTTQPAAAAAPPPASAAAPAAFSVPLAVPLAVPIAVPVQQPAPAASAAPAPAPASAAPAQPQPVPAVSAPLATPVPAASSPIAMPLRLPPSGVPLSSTGRAGSGSIAVANFSTAAPARLQPGSTPPTTVLGSSTASWPAPQQASQIAQQQQQQYSSGGSRPAVAGQQQQPGSAQQQQQVHKSGPWSCKVCTYEHAGTEAEFLFCAMCSTQKPV